MEFSDMTIDFILYYAIISIGVIVNLKLYKNTKGEERLEKGKVVQSIIKHYSIINCCFWPVYYIIIGTVYIFDKNLQMTPEWIIRYFTYWIRFLYGLARDYVSLHSFVVAIIRYTFLFYERHVESFGIKKCKKLFVAISIIIPLSNSFLYELCQPTEKPWIFWIEKTTTLSLNKSIYMGQNYSTIVSANESYYNSPLYTWSNSNLHQSIITAMHIANAILAFIIYANIIEGLLYAQTTIIYRR